MTRTIFRSMIAANILFTGLAGGIWYDAVSSRPDVTAMDRTGAGYILLVAVRGY